MASRLVSLSPYSAVQVLGTPVKLMLSSPGSGYTGEINVEGNPMMD